MRGLSSSLLQERCDTSPSHGNWLSTCFATHSGVQAGGLHLSAQDVITVLLERDEGLQEPGRLGGFALENRNAVQESQGPTQKCRKRGRQILSQHSGVVRSLKWNSSRRAGGKEEFGKFSPTSGNGILLCTSRNCRQDVNCLCPLLGGRGMQPDGDTVENGR